MPECKSENDTVTLKKVSGNSHPHLTWTWRLQLQNCRWAWMYVCESLVFAAIWVASCNRLHPEVSKTWTRSCCADQWDHWPKISKTDRYSDSICISLIYPAAITSSPNKMHSLKVGHKIIAAVYIYGFKPSLTYTQWYHTCLCTNLGPIILEISLTWLLLVPCMLSPPVIIKTIP